MKYIVASPEKVRFLHFDGKFRLVKDAVTERKARAAINFGFFAMSANHPAGSRSVGQVMTNGKNVVLSPADHFHAIYKKDGKINFWQWLPADCEWGIRAGPRLIKDGRICNESINDSAWVRGGIQPLNSSIPRVAIGQRKDKKTVLAYWPRASVMQMAQDMLNLGCIEALAGDGGGSASWYDSQRSEDTVSQRLVPNCFIIESEADLEPTKFKPMKIYISPSQQPENLGIGDYGTEQRRMFELGWLVASYLSRMGHQVKVSRPGMNVRNEIIPESNSWGAEYHLCLHSNAFQGKGKGVVGIHWPGSVKGEKVTRAVSEALATLNPNGLGRVGAESQWWEVSLTNAAAVYIEVGFHDRADEAEWIVRDMDRIASAIANAMSLGAGLPTPTSDPNLTRAQAAEAKLAEIKRILEC